MRIGGRPDPTPVIELLMLRLDEQGLEFRADGKSSLTTLLADALQEAGGLGIQNTPDSWINLFDLRRCHCEISEKEYQTFLEWVRAAGVLYYSPQMCLGLNLKDLHQQGPQLFTKYKQI